MIQTVAHAFNAGGPFMWVILMVFAVACTVVADRLIFYFLICRPNGVRLVADVAKAINAGDTAKAKKVVSSRKAPMNMLMQTAIERFNAGMNYEEIQKGVDQAAIREMPRMTQRLNNLSLFANIGTLLGLRHHHRLAGNVRLFGGRRSGKKGSHARIGHRPSYERHCVRPDCSRALYGHVYDALQQAAADHQGPR
jgi:hypothetical protein